MINQKIPAGNRLSCTIASGQASEHSWNLQIGLEADIPIDDVATVQLSTDLNFSQTTETTTSGALSFTLSSPKGVTSCYTVYAVGPANNAEALVLGIYWWNYSTSHDGAGHCVTPN